MSITITDPTLLAQLRQASAVVELRDPDGTVLGMFAVEGLGKLPPGAKSPFTREEMEERAPKQPQRATAQRHPPPLGGTPTVIAPRPSPLPR